MAAPRDDDDQGYPGGGYGDIEEINWLYNKDATPPFKIPGQKWVWNGKQWTTVAETTAPVVGAPGTETGTGLPGTNLPPNQPGTLQHGNVRLSEADGRRYDQEHNLIGGYMGPDGWVHGSPHGGGGGTGGGPGGVGGGGSGGFDPGNFQWPTLDIPTYTNPYGDYVPNVFDPPEPSDVYKDPAYQFRLDESMKPIVNQRALAGVSRGGSTMKALSNYASKFASDEYQRLFDRSAFTFNLNEGNRKGAFDTNFKNWNTGYDYKVNEATKEFEPKFDAAKLAFAQNFDIWKYLNDDKYRYWIGALNASTQGSRPVDTT